MFSYLRYFSLISLVLVFVAAYLIGVYFRSQTTNDLLAMVNRENTSVAQAYASSTWKTHQTTIQQMNAAIADVSRWKIYKEFFPFRADTFRFFENLPVALAALHAVKGPVFFSTQAAGGDIDPADQEATALFARAVGGETVFRMVENVPVFFTNGESKRATIIQTFVPLRGVPTAKSQVAGTGDVIAVLQVQHDITDYVQKLANLQYFATGGIVAIFFVLIVVLFLSMQRAESIITKQHELNLELTAAVAAAEAENRDKSQFLANISHELRTPLNAIIGFSEILKNDLSVQLTNQHREYLDDIHGSGKHLLSLINDILDFSKAEAGKLEVDVSEIDAIKMVKNSLRLVIPRAEQAQVTLMEDLPTKHFILQTDAKKIKQVLLNLLSNSVKFTPAGGEVRVSCWHNPETDKVTFEIKDTGVGIAQKDLARVMTPFGQADSTLARRFEGTGLGLPLSKKFVEIMGGTFTLTSEVNKGTTVTLVFPRMFNREASSQSMTPSGAPASA